MSQVVVVPGADVDRAKHFYSEQVGFVVDVDHRAGESFRVVQLAPRGSACSITIGTGLTPSAPGSLQGLQLVVSDIEAARAELVARGVEVNPIQYFEDGIAVEGRGEAWNSFIFFSDPDGNGWTVQERPASNWRVTPGRANGYTSRGRTHALIEDLKAGQMER